MKKQLLLFNGRWSGDGDRVYICANSKADASRLYVQADNIQSGIPADRMDQLDLGRALREINIYFSDCWGTQMNTAMPVPERGVWIAKKAHCESEKPERII
jgi:hypothetical protein